MSSTTHTPSIDKKYAHFEGAELLKQPVHAISGITEAEAEQLNKILGVKTIGDLLNNKYTKMAQSILHPTGPAVASSAGDANQAAAAAQWQLLCADQARQQVGASLPAGASLVALQQPAQGDFPWYYSNGNNLNGAVYNWISGALTQSSTNPGQYTLGAATSLTTAYQGLINQILFAFSAADSTTLQNATNAAASQAASLVSLYNSTYGAPTAADYATANSTAAVYVWPPMSANSQIDYILSYVMGYQWAGRPTTGLTLKQMQEAPSLSAVLAKAPPTAQPLIDMAVQYFNLLGPGAALRDQQSNANWALAQIKANLITPTTANGGISLFNNQSNQPQGTVGLGYQITPQDTGTVLNQLTNTNSTPITVSFTATRESSSSYNVAYQGKAGISVGSVLNFSASTSVQGDVAAQSWAGSSITVTASYPGIVSQPPVSVVPQVWSGSSFATNGATVGWYSEQILNQAFTNFNLGKNAPTGYTFQNAPSTPMGAVNTTGFVSTVVLSGYPTITVEFSNGDYNAFSQWLQTHTSMSLKLFGFISLGSASMDSYSASAQASSNNASFKMVLTPPTPNINTAPASQTVPVLGVVATWLGLSTS